MKALAKLLADFVGWRWSPAIGLLIASLFYVLVVVVLVPSEIGVPVANARFTQKALAEPTAEAPEPPTFPTTPMEAEPAPPPPAPVQQVGANDFGRRGFSPPIDRPEPPPQAVIPPPAPPPPPVMTSAAQMATSDGPVPTPPPEATPPAPPPAAVASAAPAPAPNSGIFRGMAAFRGILPGVPPVPVAPPPGAPPTMPPGAQPPAEAPPAR